MTKARNTPLNQRLFLPRACKLALPGSAGMRIRAMGDNAPKAQIRAIKDFTVVMAVDTRP